MEFSSPTDPARCVLSPESSSKQAWSQIVRGDAEAFSKKGPPQAVKQQIRSISPGLTEPDKSQVSVSMQRNAEPHMAPSDALNLNASAAEEVTGARVFDEASANGEEAAEVPKTVIDAESGVLDVVAIDSTEASQNKLLKSSLGDSADPGVSRPTWRKPSINPDGESKPQPVMGAVAWPALGEVRNIKASEPRKLKASGLKNPLPAPALASLSIQEPLSKSSLPNPQPGFKHKMPFKGGPTGGGRPAFQPIENGSSSFEHPGSDQSIKQNMHARVKGNFSANPPVDLERPSHQGPFSNNTRKWRNNNRDQFRGNYGWHHPGRAYENAGDMVTLLHEQRIGPRNMPRPLPLMNVNPAFYPVPNFQNGGMYYIPAGAPEFVPPYFPPMAPVGGLMHGPDPITLRSMLLKQIDYYFSIENLCRDVFLRTHMDDQGFVPVSVIARFNRIRTLSPNPMVILEALQQSTVVEVQHDRIRRRGDGGKWKLSPDQINVTAGQNSTGFVMPREGESRKLDRADQALVPSSQEASIGIHAASAIPLTDVESLCLRSERTYSSGALAGLQERDAQHFLDNSSPLKAQHSSDVLSQSELRVYGTDGNETISSTERDSTGHLRASLDSFHSGNEFKAIDRVTHNQESCSRDAKISESGCTSSESSIANKVASWENPEGFWVENDAYFIQGDFVQDGPLSSDSEFMLKSHQDEDEDCVDVNDKDMQRLMNATHASLGSFIAVP